MESQAWRELWPTRVGAQFVGPPSVPPFAASSGPLTGHAGVEWGDPPDCRVAAVTEPKSRAQSWEALLGTLGRAASQLRVSY